MNGFRSALICMLTLCTFATTAAAQDGTSQRMNIQAGYGTVTMGGVQWQRFSFRPDIPIGKFGIGFDLELFIDNEGKISKEGWDFSNTNRTWDTILRKVYYVRYGQPLDRLYMRAGALDDVTLGYGLIMDGYRNTLNYPGDKKLGADFAVRDFGTFGIDIHAMVNSVGDFRNKGAVAGTRIGFRPLKPTTDSILGRLVFGMTFVRDINQYAGLKDSDGDGYPDYQDGFPDDKNRYRDSDGDGYEDYVDTDGNRVYIDIDADGDNNLDNTQPGGTDNPTLREYSKLSDTIDGISVYGFDVGLPLIETGVRLDLYGQFAQVYTGDENLNGGWGIGAPGLRLIAGQFTGQVEYRYFKGRFRPNYFDNLYEHERVRLVGLTPVTKEMTLVDETWNGVHGRAKYNLFNFVEAGAGYQYMTGDASFQDVTGTVGLMENLLRSIPKISIAEAYFHNTTYANIYYGAIDKKFEDHYSLWDFTPNTFYGTRIGFEVTPGMIIVWDTRYTFSPRDPADPTQGLVKQRFVGIETVLQVK